MKTCIMLSLDFAGDQILAHYSCDNPRWVDYYTRAFHTCRFADYPARKKDSVCRHYQKQSAQCVNPQARLFALQRAVQNNVDAWLLNALNDAEGR